MPRMDLPGCSATLAIPHRRHDRRAFEVVDEGYSIRKDLGERYVLIFVRVGQSPIIVMILSSIPQEVVLPHCPQPTLHI